MDREKVGDRGDSISKHEMTTKLKARDIVSGWPRGRSTLPSTRRRLLEYREYRWTWEYQRDQQRMFDRWISRYRVPEGDFIVDERGRETRIRRLPQGFRLMGLDA
jgi:hypothetical protein